MKVASSRAADDWLLAEITDRPTVSCDPLCH